MIENNTEHILTICFIKVWSNKIKNSVRPMSDKTLNYFDSTELYLHCDLDLGNIAFGQGLVTT